MRGSPIKKLRILGSPGIGVRIRRCRCRHVSGACWRDRGWLRRGLRRRRMWCRVGCGVPTLTSIRRPAVRNPASNCRSSPLPITGKLNVGADLRPPKGSREKRRPRSVFGPQAYPEADLKSSPTQGQFTTIAASAEAACSTSHELAHIRKSSGDRRRDRHRRRQQMRPPPGGPRPGDLALDNPETAAEQFTSLCKAGLLLRALLGGPPPGEDEIARLADEAVRTFLARCGTRSAAASAQTS